MVTNYSAMADSAIEQAQSDLSPINNIEPVLAQEFSEVIENNIINNIPAAYLLSDIITDDKKDHQLEYTTPLIDWGV